VELEFFVCNWLTLDRIGTDLLATTQEVAERFNIQPLMSDSVLPTIIVPARLASSRFPSKLLADAGGKQLILRTAERIRDQAPEFDLIFAVDGEKLSDILQKAGFSTIKTSPDLPSGTDRIAQANESLGKDLIINIQADEPMVLREHILALTEGLSKENADLSTLAVPFLSPEDIRDPNQVKVVLDRMGFALYFSRSPIPYDRTIEHGISNAALKHLGMYGYRNTFLKKFSAMEQGVLENMEKLEQLRALEMGFKIAVQFVRNGTIGVDTRQDLDKIDFS